MKSFRTMWLGGMACLVLAVGCNEPAATQPETSTPPVTTGEPAAADPLPAPPGQSEEPADAAPEAHEQDVTHESAGAELELTLADDALLVQVHQERGALADHAVEAAQEPDLDAPAAMPALARRRPLRGLEVAEPQRSIGARLTDLLELG